MRRVVALAVAGLGASALVRAAPAAPAVDARGAPRVWSRGYASFVWREPKKAGEKSRLGYLRVGGSLPLRDPTPVVGPGCAHGFVAVEPSGWVCLDRSATLDAADPYVRAMRHAQPREDALPFRYALSNGAPMYRRLPTPDEWLRVERYDGPAGSFGPQSWGNRGHEHLAEVRVEAPNGAPPDFLASGGSTNGGGAIELLRRRIPHGSMLAYTASFEHADRRFLLSSDGTVVPADRVRPFRRSGFRGVVPAGEHALPLAFFREKPRALWVRRDDGGFDRAGEAAVRSSLGLTERSEGLGAERRLETRSSSTDGRSLWVLERDATVLRARTELPIGVPTGEKWLLVSITQGTLVAYDGLAPRYATLVSPGVGGVPRRGIDPVKASTTPLGVYRIGYKHRTATMSPEFGEDRSFWIADVPYVQYFAAPFALHVAYWHERFGEPMSAGCINLSPEDGRAIFDFTGPHVPDGWWGAAATRETGGGSFVVITR
jgi:hypothetical protein